MIIIDNPMHSYNNLIIETPWAEVCVFTYMPTKTGKFIKVWKPTRKLFVGVMSKSDSDKFVDDLLLVHRAFAKIRNTVL